MAGDAARAQTLRHALYGKPRRSFLLHGGDWYERIREFFRNNRRQPVFEEPDQAAAAEEVLAAEEEEEVP